LGLATRSHRYRHCVSAGVAVCEAFCVIFLPLACPPRSAR
jgi:hypothetical protein